MQSGLHLSSREKERVPVRMRICGGGGGCFAGDLIGLNVKRNLCKVKEERKKKESQLGVFSIKWLEQES